MSLFDVIKYPIDISFRLEDLERIPSDILKEWWKECIEIRNELWENNDGLWLMIRGSSTKGIHEYFQCEHTIGLHERALKALQRRLNEHDR